MNNILTNFVFENGGFIFGSYVWNFIRKEKHYRDVDLFLSRSKWHRLFYFAAKNNFKIEKMSWGNRTRINDLEFHLVDYYSFSDDPVVDIECLKLDEYGIGLRPLGNSRYRDNKRIENQLELAKILDNISTKRFRILTDLNPARIARLLNKGWRACA